jgi:hypothetical protein
VSRVGGKNSVDLLGKKLAPHLQRVMFFGWSFRSFTVPGTVRYHELYRVTFVRVAPLCAHFKTTAKGRRRGIPPRFLLLAATTTMNGRYAAYDLESFANTYQATGACVQQTQQRYMTQQNGACMEDYDPNRLMEPIAMATYNPTASRTGNLTAHHHTLLQAPTLASPGSGGLAAPGMQRLPDFEPTPLSKDVVRRLHHPLPTHLPTHLSSQTPMAAHLPDHGLYSTSPFADMFSAPLSVGAGGSRRYQEDEWLENIEMSISGLSLEPLSGVEVLSRLRSKTEDVMTRYLPCVDFLVACQQDLRKGLQAAQQKRLVHHMFRDALTPRQFFSTFIAPLPERFFRKNRRIMERSALDGAVKEIQKLCADARAVEHQGCEVMKNTFLGGMKDGESWGLRKWLSKNGGALHICNESECILHACQKLDRSLDTTKKLGERLRPLAKHAMTRLKADVPSSYQEISSAHPYLPFFHRLESALRGMSAFDPEDDDVICIDDEDEIEAVKAKTLPPPKSKPRKRKAKSSEHDDAYEHTTKKVAALDKAYNSKPVALYNSDEDDSVIIELQDDKPPPRDSVDSPPPGDYLNALTFFSSIDDVIAGTADPWERAQISRAAQGAMDMAASLDRLATMFESDQQGMIRPSYVERGFFWDEAEQYAAVLRLFSTILRTDDASPYLEQVDEEDLISQGNPIYSGIIKNQLCFRDIFASLLDGFEDTDENLQGNDGRLVPYGLKNWNMWRGVDLLQAIDLVLLNSLAYGKVLDEGRQDRSRTNRLRKLFWAGIKNQLDSYGGLMDDENRRKCTPTRRGESSGFVVHKGR